MNNWEIINLERNLKKSEYLQLYNSLLKDDTVKVIWKEPEIYYYINEVRDQLRYIHKSSKQVSTWCKKQFHYNILLMLNVNYKPNFNKVYEAVHTEKYVEVDDYSMDHIIPTIGTNVHMVCDKVWDKVDTKEIKKFTELSQISRYFYKKCLSFLPDWEIARSVYKYHFKQFADFQANRIGEIMSILGDKCDRYIKPLYRELKIENKIQKKAGTIDVVELLLNDLCGITDWKTGKPKYYYNYLTEKGLELEPMKWDKASIEGEITDYYLLCQEGAYKVISKDEIVPLEDLDIHYGRVLYLRDWENTQKFVKIEPRMIQASVEVENDIIECINKGLFRRRKTKYCFSYCSYFRICERSSEWKDKWCKVEDKFKISNFQL